MSRASILQQALLPGLAALLGFGLLLPGCSSGSWGWSGGSGSSAGSIMFVESCSLGCGNGVDDQVGCSIVNVGRNAEITLQFSEAVDLASVTSGSFQVINLNNGTVPVGTYGIDLGNPRRLIFRPGLDFDAVGNPEFAFEEDATYQIRVLGEREGDLGPFIKSATGRNNQSRLLCSILTSEGLIDPVPGAPNATVWVQQDDGNGGAVTVAADGAGEVLLSSTIVVIFDDIMNPATIANLSTGQSNTITVKIDPDGNLANQSDQVIQAGSWEVDVDFDLLRTTAVFTPSGGFPSAGGDPQNPRLTIVDLPVQLLDLVSIGLENPKQHVFSTKVLSFPEISLPQAGGETFADSLNEDSADSGGDWGSGRLSWNIGGGAGRLGPLVVRAGQVVTLNTDSQAFPLVSQERSLLDNEQPGVDYDPLDSGTWPGITITDGLFEFSSVTIEPNATLILEGSNPGRIFVRGELLHSGVIDISGETPDAHESNSGTSSSNTFALDTRFGGSGGMGGPSAGAGGQGADRLDSTGADNPLAATGGGISFPIGEVAVNDGRGGEGVGGSTATGGIGGIHYPPTMPRNWALNHVNFGDAEYSILPDDGALHTCGVAMVAGPGSGGAYSFSGGTGVPDSPFTSINPGLLPTIPGSTPGGDNSSLNIEPPGTEIGLFLVRHLVFALGHLRGGAGGGGGGTSIYGSKSNNTASSANCGAPDAHVFPLFDHSAAGGGGGGGALHLVAGRRISMGGSIDCSGGQGGSALAPNAPLSSNCTSASGADAPHNCDKFAAPGGGGSGGAVKLQSVAINLGGQSNQISVLGGLGGTGAGGSLGGDGSPGLVRIEHAGFVSNIIDADLFAPFVAPADPATPSFNDPYTSAAILSVGDWDNPQFRPETFSGSQSCWMKPVGNFFELEFSVDDPATPDDPTSKGWNMDIVYNTGTSIKKFPYRGLSTEADFPLMGGLDFETFLGSTMNHDEMSPNGGSFLVVRFQGARATGELADPCNVDLVLGIEIEPGSVTPWVRSAEELNQFSPKPNMVRFCVIFEPRLANQGTIQANIQGITNLEIRVQPN
jgi:hypothetical protein